MQYIQSSQLQCTGGRDLSTLKYCHVVSLIGARSTVYRLDYQPLVLFDINEKLLFMHVECAWVYMHTPMMRATWKKGVNQPILKNVQTKLETNHKRAGFVYGVTLTYMHILYPYSTQYFQSRILMLLIFFLLSAHMDTFNGPKSYPKLNSHLQNKKMRVFSFLFQTCVALLAIEWSECQHRCIWCCGLWLVNSAIKFQIQFLFVRPH